MSGHTIPSSRRVRQPRSPRSRGGQAPEAIPGSADDHAPAAGKFPDTRHDAPRAIGQGSRRSFEWPHGHWPAASNSDAAIRFREDIVASWQENGVSGPDPESVDALLACMGGNSPYLSDLARRAPEDFARLLACGPDRFVEDALGELGGRTWGSPRDELAQALRITKGRVALACALADIGGFWSLEKVTQTLSRLADTALDVAVRHLLRAAYDVGRLSLKSPEHPARGSGYVVLAMGKLGARELNFSSDIDLVVLFDADLHTDPDTARQMFVRITSDLVRLMEARDADGYVFRTDLRLRPDPAATPLAVSMPAAIAYYESLGQTWERAAMTKARPVAGNIGLGREFLKAIHPFVWRRNLDFALIDDIHDMKARIDRHRKPGRAGLARLADPVMTDPEAGIAWLLGHNVKLGEGGIREIEFVAQAMQLVWGGKTPDLRDRTTLGALRTLTRTGHMPREEAEVLSRAYRLLRAIEHRIQMRADQQTHDIPATREGFEALAIFMGYENGGDLALDMLPQMRAARRIFEKHFATPTRGPRAQAAVSDLSADDLPARLAAIGFPDKDCDAAATLLRHWTGNSRRALQSERSHTLLRALVPALLASFVARRDPMACLRHFDTLLSRQRAGVQLLSLLERNPVLIDRIAAIFDASPVLAAHLADTPSALEGLLEPHGLPTDGGVPARIRAVAAEQTDVESLIGRLRPLVRAEEFRLSIARLEGRLTEDDAAHARTAAADAVVAVLLGAVMVEHRRRHGRVPGGAVALVALGKAGSREMMAGSDLDLMLIFDHPQEVAVSLVPSSAPDAVRAARPLPVSQYYLRLAHSFIAALTAPDAEGPLYAVDMRLRPSGAAGPVAVSRAAFRQYHAGSAWTWERMALTRARIVTVTGEPGARSGLRRGLVGDLDAALNGSMPGGSADDGALDERDVQIAPPARDVRADAVAMRERLMRELPPSGPWDVKLRPGGLMEVEFIAQVLQLVAATPKARSTATAEAFLRLARVGMLARGDARVLADADRFWRGLQGILRLLWAQSGPPGVPVRSLPAATVQALLRGVGQPDPETLLARMDEVAAEVRRAFVRLVGPLEETAGRPG